MNHLFTGATLVHEGRIEMGDLLIEGDRIKAVGQDLSQHSDPAIATAAQHAKVHDCTGLHLLPGLIDDQVHFREPGLTHKAEIATESRAAVAGGITSFMEMPNTVPQSLNQNLLQDKYDRAAEVSPANYSFYMGASNGNLDHVLLTDPRTVCGVKVFMGSSTGDMLVDDAAVLEGIFKECPMLIATHCEDEATIRANAAAARAQFGDEVPIGQHPIIRSAEACYRSSSRAVELAARTGARLHVLHISTARELSLFDGTKPLSEKRITAEACTHHLWFTDADYAERGTRIKWNPAVKTAEDREAVRAALKPAAGPLPFAANADMGWLPCCITLCWHVLHSPSVITPTNTPVALPISELFRSPHRASALYPASSSSRWCGSMAAVSAGLIRNTELSKLAACVRK